MLSFEISSQSTIAINMGVGILMAAHCALNSTRCPLISAIPAFEGIRKSSTKAGEGKRGHLQVGPNEGIFFINNIFPFSLGWTCRIPFIKLDERIGKYLEREERSVIQRAVPSLKVIKRVPRVIEGGSLVKFAYDPWLNVKDIESSVRKYLEENPVKPAFWGKRRIKASLVKGTPWVEDLFRFPSSRVKAEFLPTAPGEIAAELSQEELFSLFRPFGRLLNVSAQRSDENTLPRYAYIDFRAVRHAVMAKNCLHGTIVPTAEGGGMNGTVLRLGYETIIKARWMRGWLTNLPRAIIPLVAVLMASIITVVVLDPVRVFLIKVNITYFSDSKAIQWFASQLRGVRDTLGYGHYKHKEDNAGLDALEDDRKESIEVIQEWLEEPSVDSLFVIQGPRDSRKKEFAIDQALKDRKHVLNIDCKPVQEARGDSKTIKAAAKQVGYWPVLLWMNEIINIIDLTAQGMMHAKTDLSGTLESKLDSIFENTSRALRKVALSGREKSDEEDDEQYLQAHPDRRPVVVIDNFLHRSQESTVFYHKISEWAAEITRDNAAHVILLTDDVSKSLSKAFPGCVFRQISLEDCSPGVAKRVVIDRLNEGNFQSQDDSKELDSCIEKLGGRIADLEGLARRMNTGESPKKAIDNMILHNASEILKAYILDRSPDWSAEEAWSLIKRLAARNEISYNEVLSSETFSSNGESTLQALEEAGLIAIAWANGRPDRIKPSRPVCRHAFQHLTRDPVLTAKLDLDTLTRAAALETQRIEKYEAELKTIAGLPKEAPGLPSRIEWVGNRLLECQARLERFEAERGVLRDSLRASAAVSGEKS